MTEYVRIQEKGQVTIPTRIRKKLKLNKGDLVMFVETSSGVLIKPAEVVISESLDEIGKALQEQGLSLDDMIERGREMRSDLLKEKHGIENS